MDVIYTLLCRWSIVANFTLLIKINLVSITSTKKRPQNNNHKFVDYVQ